MISIWPVPLSAYDGQVRNYWQSLLPEGIKNVVEGPLTFKHERLGWEVELTLAGRGHKYGVKINSEPIDLFPKSLLLTRKMGRVRKSTIKIYDNDILM